MWYEILPSYVIITVAIAAPAYLSALLNKVVFGNMYRRCLETKEFRLMYLRDRWISGVENPYVIRGLEAIDEDEGGDGGDTGGAQLHDVEREQCPADFANLSDEQAKQSGKVPQEEVCTAPQ